MENQYILRLLLLGLTLLTGRFSQAQAPTITALNPSRNQRMAPASTNVAITFSRAMSTNAATLGSVQVHSLQRGGQLRNGQGGSTSASGNTLTFDPSTNFRPGETILTTVTSSAQASGGASYYPPGPAPAPAVGPGQRGGEPGPGAGASVYGGRGRHGPG